MGFYLVEYETLSDNIIKAVLDFASYYNCDGPSIIKHYGCGHLLNENDQKKPMELDAYNANVSETRRTHVGFVLTCLNLIDTGGKELEDKRLLLNAVGCYVRTMIKDEYNTEKSTLNKLASYITSEDKSNFFMQLGYALNIARDNDPGCIDMHLMCTTLKDFVLEHVQSSSKHTRQGIVIHPFSEKRIEKFNVKEFIVTLINKIAFFDIEKSMTLINDMHKFQTTAASQKGIFAHQYKGKEVAVTHPVLNGASDKERVNSKINGDRASVLVVC
jgi:hypothetical protein